MPQKKIDFFGGLRPTGPDTSGVDRLRTLAGLTNQVQNIAFEQGAKKRKKEGLLAGAQAGIDAVKKGEGLKVEEADLFSIHDEAYNQSMKAAYVAGVDNDSKQRLSQLASDNATDLVAFNALASAHKKATLQNIDPEVSILLEQSMDSDISTASIKIRENEKQKNLAEADSQQQISIQNNMDLALSHAFEGDFQKASDSLVTAQAFNDARMSSGKISASEHQKTAKALTNAVDIEANRSQFNNLLESNEVTKMINFIQKVSDEKIKGKTPEEHRNLVSILQGDMNRHYSLIDRVETEAKDREVAKQSANNEKLFISLLGGELSANMVTLAMETDTISTGQGKALINQINSRGVGVDDHSVIISINEMIRKNPNSAKDIIMDNMGINLTGDTAERLMNNANSALDQGSSSVLNTNESKRFKKFLTKFTFDPGIGGFGSIENNKKIAQLELVFDERVLAGEDPSLVVKDLVDFNEFLDIPPPRFGNNNDPQTAIDRLNEFFLEQQKLEPTDRKISNDDFDRESLNLQRAIDLMEINNEFNQALEGALDGRN